jgi:glycine C-acetyltransferase
MYTSMQELLATQLQEIRDSGLYKDERVIAGPQQAHIPVCRPDGSNETREVLNMCANNYLGLANHPEVVAAARESLDRWGYGLSSVRFICGTQEIHKELEAAISAFLGTEDTILYTSCFDANGGLFETLLGAEDAIISDQLNHASIIDGVRLCKAQRYRYNTSDMADLEQQLKDAQGARLRLIATDGVFSMDGSIARLQEICDLADRYGAQVMVDDSHSVGVLGARGRGTHEHRGVMGRIDIITGTLGKALGGASGGYTSGRKEVIQLLRQRSRPYLFSNTVAPSIVAASLKALEILSASTELRDRLHTSTRYFREQMTANGFQIKPGEHPIVPIMLGDAVLAQKMAARLLDKGIYVIGFFYPVVPKGQARIRVQISAAHSREDLDFALRAFKETKEELGI